MRKLRVQCTVFVDIEIEDPEADLFFLIEDNGCPGTGSVGAAIYDALEKGDEAGTCWACGLQGENKIIAIDGQPVPDLS
jgi:hypothetical protein